MEDFGGLAYSKLFYGTTYDRVTLLPIGDGKTTVIYNGTEDVFTQNDVGKDFVAHRSHEVPSWPIHSYSSKVVMLVDSRTIIVDEEYLPRSNAKAEILFDNSNAWKKAIAAYDTGRYDAIWIRAHDESALNRKYYYVANPTRLQISKYNGLRIESEISRGTLKFYYDDGKVTGKPDEGTLFNIGQVDNDIVFNNVDIVGAINSIITDKVTSRNLFYGTIVGKNDREKANRVVVRRCYSDKLYKELKEYGQYEGELCVGFGFGRVNFNGREEQKDILAEPGYGYIYGEDYDIRGMSLMNYNANWSGAGPYFGTENCNWYYDTENDYAITEAKFQFKLTDNKEEFQFKKDVFPKAIEALDSNIHLWPTREAGTSRSAVFQVRGKNDDVFVFLLANNYFFQIVIPQYAGESVDSTIKHEVYNKRLFSGWIPEEGDTVLLQREYDTKLNYNELNGFAIPDIENLDYSCNKETPMFRSVPCWSTILQKYGNDYTEEDLELIQSYSYSVQLQVGDKLEHSSGTTHSIAQVKRGYYVTGFGTSQSGYCMEYKPFSTKQESVAAGVGASPDSYTYQGYVLDPPLPVPTESNRNNIAEEFTVLESRASYLNNSTSSYEGELLWMGNSGWTQKNRNQALKGSSNVTGHGCYNQRELNHDHRRSNLSSLYYRENNMNYTHMGGHMYDIVDVDTNQVITVRGKQAYTWFGSQHIDCNLFKGQYGGGYDKLFSYMDKIMRSQNIELSEKEIAKQRNFGNVNRGKQVTNNKYFVTGSNDSSDIRPRPKHLQDLIDELK